MNNTCNETFATPAVYMAERPEGYDITFEIPGAGKGDVDLHVDGRTLRLRLPHHRFAIVRLGCR